MNFITSSLVAITSLTTPFQVIQTNMTALKPNEVETKLDTIIVFTPSDKNGVPKSYEFDIDGKKKNIYFAAFSPSALNFLSEKILSQSSDKELKYSYAPKSLSKFKSLLKIEEEKSKAKKLDVLYIPDPDQKEISKSGNSLECRLYAEDPRKNFLPSPGKISKLKIW